MPATKYDWQALKAEYVRGSMSLLELAEAHGISQTTIYKQAKVRKFEEERKKYKEKVLKKSLTRASARDARAIDKLMRTAEKTIQKLNKAVTDDTVFGYIAESPPQVDEESGEAKPGGPQVVILDKADTKALVNLSTAIRNLAMSVKVMYPTGDGGGEHESGVVIMPDREEAE